MSRSYVERILRARVYDVARESPLQPAVRLSERTGNSVWLKREDEQQVFSFKLRGAYNKIYHLSEQQRSRGVVAASATTARWARGISPRFLTSHKSILGTGMWLENPPYTSRLLPGIF